jgi:hypothetical protein
MQVVAAGFDVLLHNSIVPCTKCLQNEEKSIFIVIHKAFAA